MLYIDSKPQNFFSFTIISYKTFCRTYFTRNQTYNPTVCSLAFLIECFVGIVVA